MKQKAMDVKLVVRPLIGCLTHTHFWEGPCRAGHKEDMTVEAETKAADETFKESVEALKGVIDEVQFTEPMDVRYDESFVVKKDLAERKRRNRLCSLLPFYRSRSLCSNGSSGCKRDRTYPLGKKSRSQHKSTCTYSRIFANIRYPEPDP